MQLILLRIYNSAYVKIHLYTVFNKQLVIFLVRGIFYFDTKIWRFWL